MTSSGPPKEAFSPATTFSFVIPSEAEGSAVRLSGSNKVRGRPTSHLAALTTVIGLVGVLGRGGT